ncbi:hypothetical protein MED297_04669 [Reinekea sp. MED297]|uniref:Uncharacterized protein n=1 Tax=Reinekea blandensis MED297 TaxID=314283 RepID=A4BJZ9_9GAMM|nr:hypothetical protein MED297_04669 [Reinekea sp. MED297] [Reinekea blandensis MED297]
MSFEIVFIAVSIALGVFAIVTIAFEYSKRKPEEKVLPKGIVYRDKMVVGLLKEKQLF